MITSVILLHLCWIFSIWKIYKSTKFADLISEYTESSRAAASRCKALEADIKSYSIISRMSQIGIVLVVVASIIPQWLGGKL